MNALRICIITTLFFLLLSPSFCQTTGPSGTTVNIKDFGAKGDGVTNDIAAFETAKQELLKRGGGTIYFPAGKYMSGDKGWRVFASNITLHGDGIDKTYLLSPATGNVPGIQLAPYRDAGWNNEPEQQYAYENDAKAGDTFIKLKAGQNLSNFKSGTIFFLSAGASRYDQYYGEFNIVKSVSGNTIQLVYPLCKNYDTNRSSWYGRLTSEFIPPTIGGTAVANIINGPAFRKFPYNISLDNELYEVVSFEGTIYTLKNIGKGNNSNKIPAGTKVYKARSIRIAPSTVFNVKVENMTVEGHSKALVVSNSVKTVFENVKFISTEGVKKGGLWLDGDDGRDCTLTHCIVQSNTLMASQFARSFSDVKVLNSSFSQAAIVFSEFNANYEVANCTFNLTIPPGSVGYHNGAAIIAGASTYSAYIHDNQVQISGGTAAISSQPEIQTYPKNDLRKFIVKHNTIKAEDCVSAIHITILGASEISDNTITGSVNDIFGGTGAFLNPDTTLSTPERTQLAANSICKIVNNTFDGYADGFFNQNPNNVTIEKNNISRQGDNTKGDNSKVSTNGNIIREYFKPEKVAFSKFVFKDNVFKGWNYTKNSITFTKPITKDIDISNNRFINNTGNFKKEKEFIITFPH